MEGQQVSTGGGQQVGSGPRDVSIQQVSTSPLEFAQVHAKREGFTRSSTFAAWRKI